MGKATRSHRRGHASPIGHLISMVELGKLLLTQQPSLSIHMLITSVPSNLIVESEEMKLASPINEVDDGTEGSLAEELLAPEIAKGIA
ncbi:hypothetical protein POTOM_054369 [Populus tomentosa]|uniref:Uncharacterized protein n=1 Tax=Populus tomentosa TaxID=118781 RepID=A0A8X7Y4M4_POPTO|nr:hypothetical protein POTOM_054369 [Populus tomentosa]